jgi:Helix-turn-helix domain of resolvase
MTRMTDPQVLTRGRQKKFTPERIQQIKDLVEQGTSREKIAELIGVTVGSLQVTCSRLGISLRRPKSETGAGLLRREEPPRAPGIAVDDPGSGDMPLPLTKKRFGERSQGRLLEQAQTSTASQERAKRGNEGTPVNFAIWMQYRGQQRTTELALTQQTVRQLAFEAEFRNMRIGEFVGEVIVAMLRKNLLQAVLKQKEPRANSSLGELESESCG